MLCLAVKHRKQELDAGMLGSFLREGGNAESFRDWLSAKESQIKFDVSRATFREVMAALKGAA
jgi:hypothetical protein